MLFRVRPEHRPLILQLRHYGSTVAKVMSNEKAVSKSITSITVVHFIFRYVQDVNEM